MAIDPQELMASAKSLVNSEQAKALEEEIDAFLRKEYANKTLEEMREARTFSKPFTNLNMQTADSTLAIYLRLGWAVNRSISKEGNHLDIIFQMPPAKVYRVSTGGSHSSHKYK